MTTTQVVETSVINNSLSQDYPHPDDHAKHITDTPGFKPCTKCTVTAYMLKEDTTVYNEKRGMKRARQ